MVRVEEEGVEVVWDLLVVVEEVVAVDVGLQEVGEGEV